MNQLPLWSAVDRSRLGEQQRLVEAFMLRGGWHTLAEIAAAIHAPEASVSARLRTMRQRGFTVYRERITSRGGTYKYRAVAA